MKIRFLTACGLFYCVVAFAQTKTSLSTLSPATIQLKNPEPPPENYSGGLFRHFEVIDERPDTARIGIHYSLLRFGKPQNQQLVFTAPAAQTISGYLDQYFTRPDAPYTILIVMRNLWLSDARPSREEKTRLRLRMEVYATRDSLYMPLYRLDTLLVSWHNHTYDITTVYSIWDKHLTSVFNEIADRASTLVQQKQGQVHLVSRDEIEQFNHSRFDHPIDVHPLTPGVYASFDEFKSNTPSIKEFEIKMEGAKRILYIRENGNYYYSHNAWGYCDGKNVFIMRDGALRPTWREGKAWYLDTMQIHTLDMDNGAIY